MACFVYSQKESMSEADISRLIRKVDHAKVSTASAVGKVEKNAVGHLILFNAYVIIKTTSG